MRLKQLHNGIFLKVYKPILNMLKCVQPNYPDKFYNPGRRPTLSQGTRGTRYFYFYFTRMEMLASTATSRRSHENK
eukprot:1067340-Heterocapsa_arctica.AAC.1